MTTAVETSTDSNCKTSCTSQEEQSSENKDFWRLPNTSVTDCPTCTSGTHTSKEDVIDSNQSCSSGESSTVCRICQDGENKQDLLTLCNCTGSIAKYHVMCLEQWLSVSKSDVCELCHGRFQTKRKAKPFVEWVRFIRRSPQSRYVYGDILCFLILTPLAFTSAALCGEGSWYYISIHQFVIAFGLIFLCFFLILVYFVWLVLSMRYHLNMWHKWRLDNQVVKLVIPVSAAIPADVEMKGTVV